MTRASIIVIAMMLASCGSAYKLRRAERLIKKAEAMGAVWHVDTVFTDWEVPVPAVQRDTVILNAPGDTIFLDKERLRVKVLVRHDSVYVSGECPPDTIKITVPVTVTKTITAKTGPPWWFWVMFAGVFVLGIWLGIKAAKR